MSNISLNDLKNDANEFRTVSINEMSVPDVKDEVDTKDEIHENIMDQVTAAQKRFVGNFENEMKEKFQKELEEKRKQELESMPSAEKEFEIDSKDELEVEFFGIDMVAEETSNKVESITESTINKVEEITNTDKKEVERELSKDISGNITESEKINTDDFKAILGDDIDKDFEIDNKEEPLDDDEELDSDDQEKRKDEELIKEIKELTNPITKKVNIDALQVSKNPLSVNNVITDYKSQRHISDWVLMEGKKNFSMESFTGVELEKLDSRTYPQRNRYNMFIEIFKRIFSHMPLLREQTKLKPWLQATSFFDLNHIWFNVYKSSFEKANIMPYMCSDPKCGHRFVKSIDIMDMVKYKDDASKEKFQTIFDGTAVQTDDGYVVYREQVSDNFVIDFREPSIWNVIFENALLPEKIREKYTTLLNSLAFIDTIYSIQRDSNGNAIGLGKIDYKRYPEDIQKDVASKIFSFGKLIEESFSKDEKSLIDSYIVKMSKGKDEVSYVIPGCECEKCNKIIEPVDATGEELVFTRIDLAEMTIS